MAICIIASAIALSAAAFASDGSIDVRLEASESEEDVVCLEVVEPIDEMLWVSEQGEVMLSVSENGSAMIVDGELMLLADSLGVMLSVSEKREVISGGALVESIDAMLSVSAKGEIMFD